MFTKIQFRISFLLSLVFFWSFLLFGFSKFNFVNQHKKLNIILIVIDALRPDHLGCYDYQRNTSPNIDRLSKEGVRFTTAIAPGGWTVESVPSLLTGTYSPTHQIHNWHTLRNPQIKTIAQELITKGYQCVLWSNFELSLRHLDIKDGFQRVYMQNRYKNSKPVLTEYILTTQIMNRLKRQFKNSPFFFYIHYQGCHVPYSLPASYKYMYLNDKFQKQPEFLAISNQDRGNEKYDGCGKIPYLIAENNITDQHYYISQYDGAISYVDNQIGRLTDALKELGLDRNTLIILTADHGESLGEHNNYFNHIGVYEEVIRVPLIIRFPKLFPKGKVVSEQVSLVDIPPTIFEVLGINKPYYMEGESLLALIKPRRVYHSRYTFSSYKHDNIECLALRTGSWKLIKKDIASSRDATTEALRDWVTKYELYDLKNDPQEWHNLASERRDIFKQLRQELENFNKSTTPFIPDRKGSDLSDDDKERLRSLGYVQ